jgi:nicotinamidase-related amidase
MATPLLIIDVQKGFITESTDHIPGIVEALAAQYKTVFATRFINPRGSAYRRLIHWERFAPGSEDTQLAFIPPTGTALIEKFSYSCVDAGFRARLEMMDATEVHLCGIATDNCVLKCAVDLFEAGYRPVVLAAACASHAGTDYHDWGLKILRRMIGTEQVLDNLADAGGPEATA